MSTIDDLQPSLPIAVSSVTDAERERLLALGRGSEPQETLDDPLLRLLRTADARAEHPAVVFGGHELTYRELVTRSGRLATRLRALGVGRGSRVGICVPRGPNELLAMLATWGASAAYVPLDPTHPKERNRLILEGAGPDVLITEASVGANLDVPPHVKVLRLDHERAAIEREEPLFDRDPDPDQPAYVLFTSGSTGRPKGVSVPRRAFANFLRSMAHTPGMNERDRLLAVTTITFDIAGLELHLPLWVGATVHIADRETALDAVRLRKVLESEPITILQATPVTFRLLLEAGFSGTRDARRPLRMLCGGEAMSAELARNLSPCGELWNMYGPTETTVWSTIKRIEPGAYVTIGRPIDNTQVYVLDANGDVVPEGVIGELCIGGLGLAAGYLDRPELTAEKFVANRFGPPGDRIYRTGDLARFLPNGELECLGRVDHQVKIRGFRIELGEIESCLRRVQGVREAVVTALANDKSDPKLVAYWVGEATADALRAQARESLPTYMRPAAYVSMPEFPLNTNGKIDRKALPRPSREHEGSASGHKFAKSDDEAQMAALFEEVLGLQRAPIDTDFFALGGDSVRAMELRRRIHQAFGVELPLGVLFEAPTVVKLVNALEPSADPMLPAFVPLRRGPSDRPPLLCVLGVSLYQALADALPTDRSVYGLHIPLRVNARLPLPKIQHIASRYVDLILNHVPHGPYHIAGLCFGGLVAFEIARQLKARGYKLGSVTMIDAAMPRGIRFDLVARLRALLAIAVHSPLALVKQLREITERATQRIGVLRRYAATAGLASIPAEDHDLDVVSPLADAIVERYDRDTPRLQGTAIVFRARERLEPPWRHPHPELGWETLVDDLEVHELNGSHLEILKPPEVKTMADLLDRALVPRDSG